MSEGGSLEKSFFSSHPTRLVELILCVSAPFPKDSVITPPIWVHWRRRWQPTPVFLPGESQGQWSLVGCRLWGRTESDTTDAT